MPRTDGQLRQALALLRSALEGLEDGELDAAATLFAACAKVASAGTLRCAALLGDDGARRCGETSTANLLATWCGTSASKAKRALVAVGQLERAPVAARAFAAGELSIDQVEAIAPVIESAPTRAGTLLEVARRESLRGLRQEVARTRARLVGEKGLDDAARRLHARRYCRIYEVEGGIRLDALIAGRDAATLRSALAQETTHLWRESAGQPADQLRADALVALVSGRATADPTILVHVDAAALRRGAIDGEERCEIQGLGPISVRLARELLGEGGFSLLVHDGADVATVTSKTRTVPQRLRTALLARDPHCVVPGCQATERLEIDHWRRDFADFGPTELDNLCRLCSRHHRMKSATGWRVTGGPGKWQWLPPPRARPARPGPYPSTPRGSPAGSHPNSATAWRKA